MTDDAKWRTGSADAPIFVGRGSLPKGYFIAHSRCVANMPGPYTLA